MDLPGTRKGRRLEDPTIFFVVFTMTLLALLNMLALLVGSSQDERGTSRLPCEWLLVHHCFRPCQQVAHVRCPTA